MCIEATLFIETMTVFDNWLYAKQMEFNKLKSKQL